jgi:hypothetical protein
MTRSLLLPCCFGLLLILASLPASYAAWGAGVVVTNDCFETISVSIDGSSYTLSPGQDVTHSVCESWCTGILGACKDYSWSLTAYVVDDAYDSTWTKSGSDQICGFGEFEYSQQGLSCDGMERTQQPCKCCSDYADYSDCCDYSDSDYGASRCPAPEPDPPAPVTPTPVLVPVPVPTPPSPSPVPSPPIVIDPLTPAAPDSGVRPVSFAEMSFIVNGTTSDVFDRSAFGNILSELSGVRNDWIEVNISEENNGLAARRRSLQRRRHLLRSLFQDTTSPGLLVDTKIYTENTQEAVDKVKTAVQTGQVQQKLAATNNKISSVAVNNASSSSSSSNVGAIVGGVVGGIAAVAMVAGGFAVWHTRRQKQNAATDGTAGAPTSAVVAGSVQQNNPNDSAMININPPTLPGDTPTSRSMSAKRVPSKRSSGLRGLLQNQQARPPPNLPAIDPLMSWVTEQLASNPVRPNAQTGPYEIQFGQLQVERPIGEGSFGRVYAGKFNNTPVAIKVLLEASSGRVNDPLLANSAITASSPIMVKLHEEVNIMSSMDHPNVVKFIGVCSMPPCIVTELCGQGSLSDVIKNAASTPAAAAQLPWRRRLAMAIDAAEGMRYLHSQTPPIIHRDLKSANMLVTDDFRVKISDFNLSKILDDSAKSSSIAAMNPRWLAPELFSGARGSPKCDVFAFGVTCWELLTLEVPWGNTNPWQIVSTVQQGGRLPIPERDQLQAAAPMTAACYAGYIRLIAKCWAQAPEERPDIGRVAEELRILAAGDV